MFSVVDTDTEDDFVRHVKAFYELVNKKFSDSQILSILKQAETGIPVPELCWVHGMSSAFYK